MKTKLTIFVILLLSITACKKEEDNKDKTYVPTGNFVFKINGQIYDLNATVKTLPGNQWQIFWDKNDATGSSYAALTINNNLATNYVFVDSAYKSFHCQLTYFAQNSGNNIEYKATSGVLTITNIIDGKWSGTFSGKGINKNTLDSIEITEGVFTQVPEIL